ncbi:hypothetical protein XVE_0129 [Xanthomonas vesicatoria ATCC 35937]|uniref:Uncharacterized protein n=1 Tax=Xanthomonas vesicatoria ATCC 35937 TaxID=925775 RepID=F0B7T5_9XANT|nr:hypothetical protein XVE_0129 [Xanthomonas vesicatoria ATCC 35937]
MSALVMHALPLRRVFMMQWKRLIGRSALVQGHRAVYPLCHAVQWRSQPNRHDS